MADYPVLGTALKASLKDYNLGKLRDDVIAAFVVSLVALPLSMALAIAVGLPPQHGIYTAIIAGTLVPLLGGSIMQVSGPAAAFVVVLAPIVSELGLRGLLWCSILAGFFMLAMSVARLGRLVHYVPYPVTTGFTAGIALVLSILSLNDFLGLGITHLKGEFIEKLFILWSNLERVNIASASVGVVTLCVLVFASKLTRRVPAAILGIGAGTCLALILGRYGFDVETIGSRFSYELDGKTISGVPPFFPTLLLPSFDEGAILKLPNLEEIQIFFFPALTIAVLGALESLLSATVADSLAGTRHDPNAELGAVGIGNIVAALFAGIPATGVIARTATNINAGAKSVISSSLHGVFVAIMVLFLAGYISAIPMAALAGLLVFTAYRMSHVRQFFNILRMAPKSDIAVLLVCFGFTVLIDMVAGVGLGMVCAAFLLMKRVTDLTNISLEGDGHDEAVAGGKKHKSLPQGVLVFRMQGPLFFGTIEKAFDRTQFKKDMVKALIVDMRSIPFVDMTGIVALKSMLSGLANDRRQILIVCHDQSMTRFLKRNFKDLASHIAENVSFFTDMRRAIKATNL